MEALTEYLAAYLECEQNSFQPICEECGSRKPINLGDLEDTIDRALDAYKEKFGIEHIVGIPG